MVLKAAGIAIETGAAAFSDTTVEWQKNVANTAVAKKIISANSSFRPNDSVSRWELFVFAANALGLSVSGDDLIDFNDLINGGSGSTSTGTTSTGTTTEPVVVKAGDLNVSLNPASPAAGTQIPYAGIVRFAVVDLKAGGSDITVNSVELGKAALASVNSSTKVWFEKNGLRVSGKASFTSENTAVISFAPALVIKAGATESLDLYVELADTAGGSDYQFASKTVTSSAQNVAGSFTTNALRTANYSVATATITNNGSNLSYNASADAVEFAKFTIANTDTNSDTRDIKFQSVTLYQSGSANLSNLSNIVVERNGVVVSSGATINGKALTLTLSDTIKDGTSAIYTVKAVVNNVELTNDTYQLYLKNTSDISLTETTTAFRAKITSTAPVSSNLYTVSGGDVKFERDTTASLSTTAAPGTSDVVLLKGTITAKSAVTLEDITLAYTGSLGSNTGAAQLFNTVYLQIGSSTFTWTPSNAAATFLGTATVSGTATVKMYAKLKDTAPANAWVKFNDLSLSSVTTKQYVSNSNNVSSAIGSIGAVNLTVGATNLNITRTDGLGATTLPVGVKGQVVYAAKFTSTQGNAINLSNLSVTSSGNATSYTGGNTSLTLYVDGVAKDTKNLNTNVVTFNNFNASVSTTKAVEIVIKANFSDLTTGGSFQVASIDYVAVDSMTSATVTAVSSAGAVFTVAQGAGTLQASSNNPVKSLLLANSSAQKLLTFGVKATNDDVKVKTIVVSGTGIDNVGSIALVDASGNQIQVASAVTSTGFKFENVDNASGSLVAKNATNEYSVVATPKSDTVGTVALTVKVTGSEFRTSNGTVLAMGGTADVTSNTHDIAKSVFTITNKSSTTADFVGALKFDVFTKGSTNVTLTGVTVSYNLVNYTTWSTIKLFNTNGNLVAYKQLDEKSSTGITLTIDPTYSTITSSSNGVTTSYYVKIESAPTQTGTANGFSLAVEEVSYDIDAAIYKGTSYVKNLDRLPYSISK